MLGWTGTGYAACAFRRNQDGHASRHDQGLRTGGKPARGFAAARRRLHRPGGGRARLRRRRQRPRYPRGVPCRTRRGWTGLRSGPDQRSPALGVATRGRQQAGMGAGSGRSLRRRRPGLHQRSLAIHATWRRGARRLRPLPVGLAQGRRRPLVAAHRPWHQPRPDGLSGRGDSPRQRRVRRAAHLAGRSRRTAQRRPAAGRRIERAAGVGRFPAPAQWGTARRASRRAGAGVHGATPGHRAGHFLVWRPGGKLGRRRRLAGVAADLAAAGDAPGKGRVLAVDPRRPALPPRPPSPSQPQPQVQAPPPPQVQAPPPPKADEPEA